MKRLWLGIGILVALAVAAAVGVYSGWYDISASRAHLQSTYWLLETGMRRSVRVQARDIAMPSPADRATVLQGLALYRLHCVACHGAPGVAPEPFALGMAPAPANLVHTARVWTAGELFWVLKHGIKMSGMPAWEFRLNEDQMWAIVAFVKTLPEVSPRQYAALEAPAVQIVDDAIAPPDARRGKRAIYQYGCSTCHSIPGVTGANAPVGPPLEGIGSRTMIAGVLVNTPDNLARWLRAPGEINAHSAMPDLGVKKHDAQDMAAYLATLK